MSQSRLAKLAGCNHSFVSRLESGGRLPHREMLEAFCRVLRLTDAQRADLTSAFGFLPDDVALLLETEPEVARLYRALTGDRTPEDVKQAVRQSLASVATWLEVR